LLSLTLAAPGALAQTGTPSASPAASPIAAQDAGAAATAWLVKQQLPDGSFAGFTGSPDPGVTTDALLALVAASNAGIDLHAQIEAALAYLYARGNDYASKGVGQAAKVAVAIKGAGGDTTKVAGGDPAQAVASAQPRENGLYGGGAFDHAYVILAKIVMGASVPQSAIDALTKTQIDDGSWGFDGGAAGNGDTNTTSIVIQALAAAGQAANPMVAKGIAYLQSTRLANGSFPYQPGGAGDANSTALVIQAFIAAGETTQASGMMAALTAFQNTSGAFRYQATPPDDNLFSTLQAIPAIFGVDFDQLAGASATPVA
jgi:squalene cyclase